MRRDRVPGWSRPETLHANLDEHRIRSGQFEGLVRLQGDRYYFSVRDLTRERPAIYGFGVDPGKAVAAVEQLLDLLERNVRRQSESEQHADARLPLAEERCKSDYSSGPPFRRSTPNRSGT